MYNHLVLHPQKEDTKPDHIEPIKNKVRLRDITDDEYLKIRRHGLELILSGKGTPQKLSPNCLNCIISGRFIIESRRWANVRI
jgi:hypothetical protein